MLTLANLLRLQKLIRLDLACVISRKERVNVIKMRHNTKQDDCFAHASLSSSDKGVRHVSGPTLAETD